MARFTTLYSGSSGNCAVLEEAGRFLLIDMGKSCRQTAAALQALGLAPSGLAGILLTHEHADHVAGLRVFLKKWNVPVYGCAASLDYLAGHGLVPPGAQLEDADGRALDIAGFQVESFATSHDSAACCGYRVTAPAGGTLAIATDLGYVSDEVMANLYCADVVALESNYDRYMLMQGPYPAYLKYRIDSSRGHLCNDDCAQTVARLAQNGCEKFVLCHLSQENNEPALALGSARLALEEAGVAPSQTAVLRAASRHAADEWLTV
ncbi:MAG TPA: MBL fold metallo-hydrolase [Candidatus Ruthenibacterium merdigallinarum]|nr:MBL fold metallo-hydrolase [Candidatus Ruthenibacterium merdigallinarum]